MRGPRTNKIGSPASASFRYVKTHQKLFTVEDHIVLVGDASGTLSMYQLRERQVSSEPPRSFTFWSPGLGRKESMESCSPTDLKKTVLDYSSPVLESDKRTANEEDRKSNKDPKYAFGYFINRNRYYKQSNPLFMLELIGTKQIAKDKAIRDIKVNQAQTRIYVLLCDGTARFL